MRHVQLLSAAHNAAGFLCSVRMSSPSLLLWVRRAAAGDLTEKSTLQASRLHAASPIRRRLIRSALHTQVLSKKRLLSAQQTLFFATMGLGSLHLVPVAQQRLPSLVSHKAAAHNRDNDWLVSLLPGPPVWHKAIPSCTRGDGSQQDEVCRRLHHCMPRPLDLRNCSPAAQQTLLTGSHRAADRRQDEWEVWT